MSRSQQGMPGGGFNRSASSALGRGLVLILVAVVIGVLLLRSTDGSEPFRAVGDDGGSEETPGTDEPAEPTDGETPTTDPVAPAPRDPSQVTVLVANAGTGVKGAAQRLADTLKGANYVTATPVNAPSADVSMVYFVEGYEAEANALAGLLNPVPAVAAMPDPAPVAELGAAHLLVVMAADLAGSV